MGVKNALQSLGLSFSNRGPAYDSGVLEGSPVCRVSFFDQVKRLLGIREGVKNNFPYFCGNIPFK